MDSIIECVINVSEGRRQWVVDQIAQSIAAVKKNYLLHRTSDADHHRSVFTFAGHPLAVEEAAWQAICTATGLIDIREHQGVHPRIGAVDVVPFIPLRNASMGDCVEVAHRLGRRVGEGLLIPVYFYERAAYRGRKTNLAEIRRGQLEGLKKRIEMYPEGKPDFGPSSLHPTAGALAIGAREILIAFNVYVSSSDVNVAREIARRIRERDGGLPGIQALGLDIRHRKQVQVSINITDPRRISLGETFDAVAREAGRLGVEIAGSEIIGMLPEQALPKDVARLRLEHRLEDHLLEPALERAYGAHLNLRISYP